jgi:hypothetical protein
LCERFAANPIVRSPAAGEFFGDNSIAGSDAVLAETWERAYPRKKRRVADAEQVGRVAGSGGVRWPIGAHRSVATQRHQLDRPPLAGANVKVIARTTRRTAALPEVGWQVSIVHRLS